MPSGRTRTDHHIAELAELYGWRHHYAGPSLTAGGYTDGFPSHVLLRAEHLVFLAVAGRGMTAPEEMWVHGLAAVTTVEMHVVGRGELRPVTRLLRPDDSPAALQPEAEPRAPPARGKPKKNVRPRAAGRTSEVQSSPNRAGGTVQRTTISIVGRATRALTPPRVSRPTPIGEILRREVARMRLASLQPAGAAEYRRRDEVPPSAGRQAA